MRLTSILVASATVALTGCPDIENPGDGDNVEEVITTVKLSFAPEGGGTPLVFSNADPENDGSRVIDPIALDLGTNYALTVQFLNELEDPAEDITVEVKDEGVEHQIFIYGSGVQSPATATDDGHLIDVAYADTDDNDLPVGLENTVDAVTAGTGELKLMLRHLPPESDTVVKVEGLAADFANDGSAGIPGDVDVDVTFPITVE